MKIPRTNTKTAINTAITIMPVEMILSVKSTVAPKAVRRYLTRSNSRLATFSRL